MLKVKIKASKCINSGELIKANYNLSYTLIQ